MKNDYGSLEGTLALPARYGKVPVVVIVSGTGQTDRNANKARGTSRTDAYRMLSDGLVNEANVAVFRYDDHAVGKSATAVPPNLEDFTIDLEIADVARFVRALRGDPRISKVFIAGHSLGSLIGSVVASVEPIDGLISLEGPGRRPRLVFEDQLAKQGATDEELAVFDGAFAKLEQGQLPGELPGAAGELLPPELQPYYASFMKRDPAVELRKLAMPAAITHGTVDEDVSIEDANALKAAKPNATLYVIDGMAHMLKEATASAKSQKAAGATPEGGGRRTVVYNAPARGKAPRAARVATRRRPRSPCVQRASSETHEALRGARLDDAGVSAGSIKPRRRQPMRSSHVRGTTRGHGSGTSKSAGVRAKPSNVAADECGSANAWSPMTRRCFWKLSST